MMKTNHQNNNPSLRLIVDCESLSVATLDLAVEMAASVKTQLQVFFIEDEDLLRISGLPFTSEICRSTAQQSPTDEEQMQRSLRSRASQFRKTLQSSAQATGIAWSLDSISGKATDVGLQTEVQFTYTILAQPVSFRAHTKNHRHTRRVLVLGNQLAHIKQALQVVLKSFSHEKIEITLIQIEGQNRLSPQEFLHERDDLEKRFSIAEPPPEQLSLILSGTDIQYDCAILSRRADVDTQRQLIKNLTCPVILVG